MSVQLTSAQSRIATFSSLRMSCIHRLHPHRTAVPAQKPGPRASCRRCCRRVRRHRRSMHRSVPKRRGHSLDKENPFVQIHIQFGKRASSASTKIPRQNVVAEPLPSACITRRARDRHSTECRTGSSPLPARALAKSHAHSARGRFPRESANTRWHLDVANRRGNRPPQCPRPHPCTPLRGSVFHPRGRHAPSSPRRPKSHTRP